MANEYVNKVVVGGVTKLDLTGDTVDPEHLMAGYTAHNSSGAPILGTRSAAVVSVNGKTGDVILTSSDIQATGNTIQGALDSKVDLISGKADPAQISSKFFWCGSNLTLTAGHANGFLLFQSDSNCTVTIPADVLPVESELDIYRFGTGEVYINGASGVNIFSPAGWTHKIAFQNGCVHLKQYGTNQWVMTGDVFDLLDDNQKRHIFAQHDEPTSAQAGDIWFVMPAVEG